MNEIELMDGFLGGNDEKRIDAKWNIFGYQNHILYWLGVIAHNFQQENYTEAFKALTNLYADTNGFFEKKEEQELLKTLYTTAHVEYVKYIRTSSEEVVNTNQITTYSGKLYLALLNFRFEIMRIMAEHQMLMRTERKGYGGATSAL